MQRYVRSWMNTGSGLLALEMTRLTPSRPFGHIFAYVGVTKLRYPMQQKGVQLYQREIVGRDARMRWEKSGAPSAACAAPLISERSRNSSYVSVVSTRPE